MVLVIDDRYWGLESTNYNQGVSAPLIGTKSKMCPSCDAGSIQNLSTERSFPQEPVLTVNNRLDQPASYGLGAIPEQKTQAAIDGGSNVPLCQAPCNGEVCTQAMVPCATNGGSNAGSDTENPLGKIETVIAGLGILVILGAGLAYGAKKIIGR